MGRVTGILLLSLLAGSFAIPTPETQEADDRWFDSELYIHADRNARIVGGTVARQGSAPWMAAMTNGANIRSLVCGGSVITSRTVLTAAHCIAAVFSNANGLSQNLRVTVGTNRWNTGGELYALSGNVTHPEYNRVTIKNDIGVLITANLILFSNVVQPVPLATDYAGANVLSRVTGWGRIGQGLALSQDLLEVTVNTLSGQQCIEDVARAAIEQNMIAPPIDPAVEICTFHSHNHGTCNGDSGSALVRVDRVQQIGIVSWGFPCARGAPDMFVRVSAFIDWLQENTV